MPTSNGQIPNQISMPNYEYSAQADFNQRPKTKIESQMSSANLKSF